MQFMVTVPIFRTPGRIEVIPALNEIHVTIYEKEIVTIGVRSFGFGILRIFKSKYFPRRH